MTPGPIIISGPSGSGKSTLIRGVLDRRDLPLRLAVSATTREPRPGEIDGVHYHFWTKERFLEGVERCEFLEYAFVHEQNYYDPSVWYEWTAPATGGVTIDTAGSTFNTVTGVYTGSAVNALTRVATTANNPPSARVKRSFRAVAGQTYRCDRVSIGENTGNLEVAETKMQDLNANDIEAAMKMIEGTARSMGLEVA